MTEEKKYDGVRADWLHASRKRLFYLLGLRDNAQTAHLFRKQVEEHLRKTVTVTGDESAVNRYIDELNKQIGALIVKDSLRDYAEVQAHTDADGIPEDEL